MTTYTETCHTLQIWKKVFKDTDASSYSNIILECSIAARQQQQKWWHDFKMWNYIFVIGNKLYIYILLLGNSNSYISSFPTLDNRMLGQARPNYITQVMIYNLAYDL